MNGIEIVKAVFLGIVEGITEWLPISSTGHMILVDEFLKLNVSPEFLEMFLVVIQLGAILAVAVLYFSKLCPVCKEKGRVIVKKDTIEMWMKIMISCIPAALVGLLLDDEIDALFYNWQTVSVMLILFGIFFLIMERYNQKKIPRMESLQELTRQTAFWIGIFQLMAAVFPGTSRSGATILGALFLGVSRTVAAEYTFFLGIPVMFGASALKLLKFGFSYTTEEVVILLAGMVSAFLVSVITIKFLIGYIKNHDFTVFGWYRIILGIAVMVFFSFGNVSGQEQTLKVENNFYQKISMETAWKLERNPPITSFKEEVGEISRENRLKNENDPYTTLEKKVALTFDDGPNPDYTRKLLEGLQERKVKATFFLLGEEAEKYPEIVREIQKDGHLIGTHAYDHVNLGELCDENARQQVLKTNDILYHLTGEYPQYMRPPFGCSKCNLDVQTHMIEVLWDVDPMDWNNDNATEIAQKVIKNVNEDDIILLHDASQSTIDAAFSIIDTLKKQGYVFVTVDELLFP